MDLSPIARGVAAAGILAGWVTTASGQALPGGPGPYEPGIPTVAEIRGEPTGADFSTASEVVRVLERIGATSRRVALERYGTTAEGRPLILAWISAPENLARLDELRAANVALGRSDPSAAVADEAPLFVWFAFGVHGDEPAGPEAALELAYHLAASRDPVTTSWLERVVVAIDPLQNPDGYERYVDGYRSRSGSAPDPDPRAREHRLPWPSGRTNGLLFDLNRDWAWGIMPETRARWKVYLETLPQVVVDFHEMDAGSSYFFFPPAEPIHPLLPASTLVWAERFGAANAAAFRSRGWAYYTRRDFDLLYPGYGDAWSSFHGATGMTYEQAGGGRAGLALKVGGRILTLGERIDHHLQAALATLEEAADRRIDRLADFRRFWGPAGRVPIDAHPFYLIPPAPGADGLAVLLAAQGVRVETTAGPVGVEDVVPLPGSPRPAAPLPAGTLVVSSNQPLGRYAAAMLDPVTLRGSTTSDVSAWALPLLFDVPAYAAGAGLAVERRPWRMVVRVPPRIPPGVTALAWRYGSVGDVLAALRLVGRGETVQLAQARLAVGDQVLPRGTFVLPVGEERAVRAARELARLGVTARVLTVPLEDVSGALQPLRMPRVALAGGEPVLETSAGAVRHLLARSGVHADPVGLGDLAWSDLEAWDVIVLPDGAEVGGYARRLERAGERLEAWVEAGGTLVGVRAGA
ncbi:MAG TPA: M14 family metallopeptidase, partial [Gemmatimonadota bacterium]|nr:M14 family metallopeptidase [Gemmatimonadota bacterium]